MSTETWTAVNTDTIQSFASCACATGSLTR
jgi:hypothetical protein